MSVSNDESLRDLLRDLRPKLNSGTYAFALIPAHSDLSSLSPIATFRESEGLTLILEETIAHEARLEVLFRAAWITLEVQSDLAAVGLTAAISKALAAENIACNVVAAAVHDHLFVPIEDAQRAMAALTRLQLENIAD
jgi:hypothetical protein